MILINQHTDWLNSAAEAFPSANSLVSKQYSINYQQLNERVNSYADSISYYNLKSGSIVALNLQDPADSIAVCSACWRLGVIPSPLNYKLSVKEKLRQIDILDASLIINDGDEIVFKQIHAVSLQGLSALKSQSKYYCTPKTNDIAVIIFTSGSTGTPKGVRLTFGNLFSSAAKSDKFTNYMPDDISLASIPFYHIGGFMIFIRSLLTGGSVAIPNSFSTDDIISALNDFDPSIISFVPTVLKRILERGISPNKRLRCLYLGGSGSDKRLIENALRKNYPLVKVYGSTETCSMVTALHTDICKNFPLSSGKVLGESSIVIVDKENKPVPINSRGEILVKSPSLFKDYVNNHIETGKKLRDGFYYTGDLGYINTDGLLFIEKRIDDVFISGGENISIYEIETAIKSLKDIKNAAVITVDSDEWVQSAAAFIQLEAGANLNEREIVRQLKEIIAGYKIPKHFYFVDELPEGDSGKMDLAGLKRIMDKDVP